MPFLAGFLALLLATQAGAAAPPGAQYDIAAYYWPAYHDEPLLRSFFRGSEGEWEIIRNAKPKFDGHIQPRVPLWGYEDESNPEVMAKKINAAAAHGVTVPIFDWYWYNGAPFLEKTLNDGFLKARNNSKLKFYLMWANHDAKTTWDIERSHQVETIWPGTVDRRNFDIIADRVIRQYFKQPSYYKIDGKPVFSIYDLSNLIQGLGGAEATKEALNSFRAKTKSAGFPGLHLQIVLWGRVPKMDTFAGDATQSQLLKFLGADSLTNYQWVHVAPATIGDYTRWGDAATQDWEKYANELPAPYYPHVSVGWDTNPRFKALRPGVIVNSPDSFSAFLQKAKSYVDRHHKTKLVTINSWNEWSEGSYLEPDTRWGFRYLEAVKKVFSGAWDFQ